MQYVEKPNECFASDAVFSPAPFLTVCLQIDAAVLDHVVKDGYKSVLNLRRAEEANLEKEEELVKAKGLSYANVPIMASADGIDAKAVRAAAEALHGLPQPAFVHCASAGRATAVVLAHHHLYVATNKTFEDFVNAAASVGFVYNPNWQTNLKAEFYP